MLATRYTLIERPDGTLDTRGYTTPPLTIVAQDAKTLVCKCPGRSVNLSGIRGLRDDRYVAAEMIVFSILEKKVGAISVHEVIRWPVRPKATLDTK